MRTEPEKGLGKAKKAINQQNHDKVGQIFLLNQSACGANNSLHKLYSQYFLLLKWNDSPIYPNASPAHVFRVHFFRVWSIVAWLNKKIASIY